MGTADLGEFLEMLDQAGAQHAVAETVAVHAGRRQQVGPLHAGGIEFQAGGGGIELAPLVQRRPGGLQLRLEHVLVHVQASGKAHFDADEGLGFQFEPVAPAHGRAFQFGDHAHRVGRRAHGHRFGPVKILLEKRRELVLVGAHQADDIDKMHFGRAFQALVKAHEMRVVGHARGEEGQALAREILFLDRRHQDHGDAHRAQVRRQAQHAFVGGVLCGLGAEDFLGQRQFDLGDAAAVQFTVFAVIHAARGTEQAVVDFVLDADHQAAQAELIGEGFFKARVILVGIEGPAFPGGRVGRQWTQFFHRRNFGAVPACQFRQGRHQADGKDQGHQQQAQQMARAPAAPAPCRQSGAPRRHARRLDGGGRRVVHGTAVPCGLVGQGDGSAAVVHAPRWTRIDGAGLPSRCRLRLMYRIKRYAVYNISVRGSQSTLAPPPPPRARQALVRLSSAPACAARPG
ncbi:hypothetical protein F1735_00585 [Massilia sp. CCM 8694]|uniref:Uncharacterized protein n=1 Tax=Massilia genomosp. 1 TaxID=2609280 RepID=A0ABX0MDI3_9BURK|nr:hypothetical protein [Massilia genomosp. 1]